MRLLRLAFTIVLISESTFGDSSSSAESTDKSAALQFLQQNDIEQKLNCRRQAEATWQYYTNLTDENRNNMLQATKESNKFQAETYKKVNTFDWKSFENDDPTLFKWFKTLSKFSEVSLPADKAHQLQELIANMTDVYSTAKICNQSNTCTKPTLELEPDLVLIMVNSQDYEELQRVWLAWRDATGKLVREPFVEYVQLKNEEAKLNGYADAGEQWRDGYGNGFRETVESLWQIIKPFYLKLHAYTRKRLMEKFPGKIKPDGPIPAHILGNMWAATWLPLFKILQPYMNETAINVTNTLIEKNFTALEMFKISEEFFTSLGLRGMTSEFWNKSLILKPKDREVLCHPLAMDFCDGSDVRIKMCTLITMDDLLIIHHEMGHVQYYLQYASQPYVFQGGANPGFHEAVGDALALSVSTPTHLQQIGLLEDVQDNYEADINFLMQMALDKIAFLPFAYLLDLWRWEVFSGNISTQDLNTQWWQIELDYQGICPPVKRTEADLDPATLLHVIADVPYMNYFISFIIQFQFHKALCKEAGFTGPLYKCDIYKNKEAGKLLSDVLSKGSSISWQDAMLILTKGETNQMDATGLLEYFDPLIKWLDVHTAGETIGWNSNDPTQCP